MVFNSKRMRPVGIWIKIHLNPNTEVWVMLEKAEQYLFNGCFFVVVVMIRSSLGSIND
jgi:hypothetical protein